MTQRSIGYIYISILKSIWNFGSRFFFSGFDGWFPILSDGLRQHKGQFHWRLPSIFSKTFNRWASIFVMPKAIFLTVNGCENLRQLGGKYRMMYCTSSRGLAPICTNPVRRGEEKLQCYLRLYGNNMREIYGTYVDIRCMIYIYIYIYIYLYLALSSHRLFFFVVLKRAAQKSWAHHLPSELYRWNVESWPSVQNGLHHNLISWPCLAIQLYIYNMRLITIYIYIYIYWYLYIYIQREYHQSITI